MHTVGTPAGFALVGVFLCPNTMPIAAPRPCSHPGCGALVRDGSGRCARHPKPAWAKKVTETKRIGGRQRQALRAALWAADPHCAHCLRLVDLGGEWERDHIVPLMDGGSEEVSNTQVLCIPCHEIKSEAERLRAQRRGRG